MFIDIFLFHCKVMFELKPEINLKLFFIRDFVVNYLLKEVKRFIIICINSKFSWVLVKLKQIVNIFNKLIDINNYFWIENS